MNKFKQQHNFFRPPVSLQLRDLTIYNIKTLSTNEILNFLTQEVSSEIYNALKKELIQKYRNNFYNLIIESEQK